jgi:hypothetical protein
MTSSWKSRIDVVIYQEQAFTYILCGWASKASKIGHEKIVGTCKIVLVNLGL